MERNEGSNMTPKQMLEHMIDEAWTNFNEIATAEAEDGYSDAMVSMERTEACGYAEGLESAYYVIFNEKYVSNIDMVDQSEIEEL
jgi:hypothetical protein